MDKIGFARLVSYVSTLSGKDFDEAQLAYIDSLISASATPVPTPRDVVLLVESMASDRKIEAIKAFRSLTGWGLKESKDAVESVMERMRSLDSMGARL